MSCLPYFSCQLDFWASFLCDFLYFQEVCKVEKAGTRIWERIGGPWGFDQGSGEPVKIEKGQVYLLAAIWAVHHGAVCDAGYRQWWELGEKGRTTSDVHRSVAH